MKSVKLLLKQNIILVVAIVLAVVTTFIVKPDKEYIQYFDYKTLSCLFCTLAVVCALKNINFFSILAKKIINKCKNIRLCTLLLVYITFIGSMLIANDMALITFLPLGYYVLKYSNNKHLMAFVFILQNIAANLGGMLTPFGNPQNLFIYTKYNISNPEFIKIMFPPFILSIILITLCIFIIKPKPITLNIQIEELNKKRAIIYFIIFAVAIFAIFRIIPYQISLITVLITLLIIDRTALKKVDYSLLFTFVFFFIFAGNLSRIEPVKEFLSGLLSKNTLLTSTFSCQFISNVPSAILLSRFTTNYKDLLLGVNIGGVGTLIASLASLITFKEYIKYNPNKKSKYLGLFSLINFSFLIILVIECSLI